MRPSNKWPAPADRSNWLRPKGQFKKRPHRRSDRELGVDAGRISKWKQRGKKTDLTLSATLTQEQQEIRRLQRALREAQLERDILKKAVSIFSRGDRVGGPGRYSDL